MSKFFRGRPIWPLCVALLGCIDAARAAPWPAYVMARAMLSGSGCPSTLLDDLDEGRASLGVSASAHVNASSVANCEPPFANFTWDGYALGRSDLSTGELHAVAYASGAIRPPGGSVVLARIETILMDTVFVEGAGSGRARFGLDVDGMADAFGSARYEVHACLGVSLGDLFPPYECRLLANSGEGEVIGRPGHEEVDWQLGASAPITGEPINLYASLIVVATDGWYGGRAVADLGHTARLSVELPDGMHFTSRSGVLLSHPAPTAMPEPSTLLLASLPVLFAAGRRRASARPDPILLALIDEDPGRIARTPWRWRLRAEPLRFREPSRREQLRRAVHLHPSRLRHIERGIRRVSPLEHSGVTFSHRACGPQPGAFQEHEGEMPPTQHRPSWGEKPRMGPVRVAEVARGWRRTTRGAVSGVA